MMNLIYQYWDGTVNDAVLAGSVAMEEYAERIGCDYIFEENPRYIKDPFFGKYAPHFGAFKPVYEQPFRDYDNVMFCDTDIFPRKDLTENIFSTLPEDYDVAIAQEPDEPARRAITLGRITSASDNKWADLVKKEWSVDVPRDKKGRVTVYNTGVVVYSNKGMKLARENWFPFRRWVAKTREYGLDSFYSCDQPYLHAMMFARKMNIHELSPDWNSIITGARLKGIQNGARHLIDGRSSSSKFVHCQFPGADNMDHEKLVRIANQPQSEWDYEL